MELAIPTEKVEAELIAVRNALQESDARFETLADALPHMVWSTLPDGFHDYFNARWYDFTGVPAGSTDGAGWNEMFHPDDRDRAWSLWRESLATGEPYEIEYRLRHRSGDYRWTLGRALPMRDKEGRIVRWIGTCTDVDDAKRQAEQVELLSRELSHRIKNIFAVITGLIGLSVRRHPSCSTYANELQGRIAALGRAHEFVRPSGDPAALAGEAETLLGMLRQILSPYPALEEGRISVSGEDIIVDERGATPIGLLVHELATNASKYGALSSHRGHVDIVAQTQGSSLRLSWSETGGPEVSGPPAETGFGTVLADVSIQKQLGGRIERVWNPRGLRVQVEVPIARLSRTAHSHAA